MSDTPRTDEAIRIGGIWQDVMIEHARQLERENAALRARIRRALNALQNGDKVVATILAAVEEE